jgi:small Trp-rich protein
MYFLGLGIVLLLMKYLEMGPVATWSWLVVLAPFALAVVWWAWADASGYTRRKAMEAEDKRRQDRINKQREAMGIKRGRR